MTEKEVANHYLKCSDVAVENCYLGSKCCGTCMYMRDHDSAWRYYKFEYCMRAKTKRGSLWA